MHKSPLFQEDNELTFIKAEHFQIDHLKIGDSAVLLFDRLLLSVTVINRHRKRLFIQVGNDIIRVPKTNQFIYKDMQSWLLNIPYPKIFERRILERELSITVSPLAVSSSVSKAKVMTA